MQDETLLNISLKEIGIDVSKYGFELISEKGSAKLYGVEIDDVSISLILSDNICSIRIGGDYNVMVANEYEVSTQEQFDYLVTKGKAGHLFPTS